LFRRELYADQRERFLLAWILFGFVFFSRSENKLPGYLLPLLPPLAILMALGATRTVGTRWHLAIAAGMLGLIPTVGRILPQALMNGLTRTQIAVNYEFLLGSLVLSASIWWITNRGHRDLAAGLVTVVFIILLGRVVWNTYPILDRTVSARNFWRTKAISPVDGTLCVDSGDRAWRYSLNFYARRVVPGCPPE